MLSNTHNPLEALNDGRFYTEYRQFILSKLEPVQFLKRTFYRYNEAMQAMNLSTHPHQLQKRIERYPNDIITINAVSYISSAYLSCLANYKATKEQLLTLKNGGVSCK